MVWSTTNARATLLRERKLTLQLNTIQPNPAKALTPAVHDIGTAVVEIADSVGSVFTTDGVSFTFAETVVVSSVEPRLGPIGGGTRVTIKGKGFRTDSECHFGEAQVVAAEFISSTEIVCTAPAKSEAGSVILKIGSGGVDFGSSEVVFRFYTGIAIQSVFPTHGYATGNTSVYVTGSSFLPTANLTCRFGSTVVSATFLTPFSVHCLTPAMPPERSSVAVSNNGVDFAPSAGGDSEATFTTHNVETVSSIEPSRGSFAGGTSCKIFGTGFTASDSLRVRFGTSIVRATFVSTSELAVTVPAAGAAATSSATSSVVQVTVSTNGQQFTTSSATFAYERGPTVTKVEPVVVPTGYTGTFNVTGANFDFGSSSALCKIGTAQGLRATVISTTTALCAAPAAGVLSTGVAVVSLSMNGADFSPEGPSIRVVQAPSLASVGPSFGVEQGATSLVIRGTDFPHWLDISCRFGLFGSSPATWLNSTALACTSVPARPQTVNLFLSVNGLDFAGHLAFTYVPSVTLFLLSPAAGPLRGRFAVTVEGTNFIAPSLGPAFCNVGGRSVRATHKSPSLITCMFPPGDAGVVSVHVTDALGHHLSVGNLTFVYEVVPDIASVAPRTVSASGGGVIDVFGKNFLQSSSLACKFGDTRSPRVLYVSPGHVRCATVALPGGAATPSTTTLAVSNDGVNFGPDYTVPVSSPVVITGAVPTSGPTYGGTTITIVGAGFVRGLGLFCSFGGVQTSATVLSETSITCSAPAMAPGVVELDVLGPGGGVDGFSLSYTYELAVTLFSLNPAMGSTVGHDLVVVKGTNFKNSSSLSCQFGAKTVSAVFFSPEMAKCRTPSNEEGLYQLKVSNNGKDFTAQGLNFLYASGLSTINKMEPVRGPLSGGTLVYFTGLNFDQTGDHFCVFRFASGKRLETFAHYVNSTTMYCTSPAASAADAQGAAEIALTHKNENAADVKWFQYTFMEDAVVSSIYPMSVSETGGQVIEIRGRNFVESSSMICRFGYDKIVVGHSTSLGTAYCVAPLSSPGPTTLEVSFNGQDFTKDTTKLVVLAKAMISSVSPSLGPSHGGTPLQVRGRGFSHDFAPLYCGLGQARSAATVISRTVITCNAPSVVSSGVQSGGAKVAIYHADGTLYVASNTVDYKYHGHLAILGVAPALLSLDGKEEVVVACTNVTEETSTIKCRFGDVVVSGNFVSQGKVRCTVPVLSLQETLGGLQTVALAVSLNGVEYSNAYPVPLVETPAISQSKPNIFADVGGSTIRVIGSGFHNVSVVWSGIRNGASL